MITDQNLDHEKLREIIAMSILDEEDFIVTDYEADDICDVQGWVENHKRLGYWCDYPFLVAAANYLHRDFIILPIYRDSGHGDTGQIVINARESNGEPLYFLSYFNIHFQSIRPKPALQ